MSAETLREAAALMRERAEAATGATHHWWAVPAGVGVGRVFCGQVFVAETDETLGGQHANAEHIASWHPAVALAVADWLDSVAVTFEQCWEQNDDGNLVGYDTDDDLLRFEDSQDSLALAVARAYLGTTS